MTTLYDFTAKTLAGSEQSLSDYQGKVELVVNTASKSGLTPQFAGLQKLYDDHSADGLVVLGFPCGQFAHQEFDEDAPIADFCQRNYGVTFPMFSKIDVNGPSAHVLYKWLRASQGGLLGDAIKWNFTKFLVDRSGHVVARYAPTTEPAKLDADISALH